MVIWLTGISGSGKTTLARNIILSLKSRFPNIFNVDGDEVRELFGNNLGFSLKERIIQIGRIQKLSKYLETQGIIVIASALYYSKEISEHNKNIFKEYYEIYLKASIELVSRNDTKGIYYKAKNKNEKNIVGLDIKWNEPLKPYIIIDRDKGINEEEALNEIINKIPFKD